MNTPGFYLGTSGIALPLTKENFPEAYRSGTRLTYYGSVFNSLEVNSSFYKTPQATTFAKWSSEVQDDFHFTVKLSKAVTHANKLDFDAAEIDKFLQAASALEWKKGALLVQFPASISNNYFDAVEVLLARINSQNSEPRWQVAVEFRHISWYGDHTYQMLERHRASLVIHDMPGSATLEAIRGEIIYLRFHGPTGDYKGSYSPAHLQHWAEWLVDQQQKTGKTAYVYFNNTMGDAYNNAQLLRAYMEKVKD